MRIYFAVNRVFFCIFILCSCSLLTLHCHNQFIYDDDNDDDDDELALCVAGAHPMSQVTRVDWLDNETLVTAGHDSCIKQWHFKLN